MVSACNHQPARSSGQSMTAKTCGPLYFEARTATGHDGEITAFAAGHATGLAEKVYLGACEAAMLRPEPENYEWLLATVRQVAHVYGLAVQEYKYPENGPRAGAREIWMLDVRDEGAGILFNALTDLPANSPSWHATRGKLCGVPMGQIDYVFHERQSAT